MPIQRLNGKRISNANYDLDTLKERMGVETVEDTILRFLRRGDNGDTIYIWVDPYTVEIQGPVRLRGGPDPQAEQDRRSEACADI